MPGLIAQGPPNVIDANADLGSRRAARPPIASMSASPNMKRIRGWGTRVRVSWWGEVLCSWLVAIRAVGVGRRRAVNVIGKMPWACPSRDRVRRKP